MSRETLLEAGRELLADTIRVNVRAELERRGLSQVDLGKMLVDGDDASGAGVRRVRRLLAPGSKPDTDTIADFAAALKIQPFELLQPPGRQRKRAKPHDPSNGSN
jgi:hypothetical protein